MQDYSGIVALIIYIVCFVVFLRYNAKHSDEQQETKQDNQISNNEALPLDIQDEDATVASLIAAIECRNEYHKNVQIVSVRRID